MLGVFKGALSNYAEWQQCSAGLASLQIEWEPEDRESENLIVSGEPETISWDVQKWQTCRGSSVGKLRGKAFFKAFLMLL